MTVEVGRRVGRVEGEQAAQGIVIAFEDLAIGSRPCAGSGAR